MNLRRSLTLDYDVVNSLMFVKSMLSGLVVSRQRLSGSAAKYSAYRAVRKSSRRLGFISILFTSKFELLSTLVLIYCDSRLGNQSKRNEIKQNRSCSSGSFVFSGSRIPESVQATQGTVRAIASAAAEHFVERNETNREEARGHKAKRNKFRLPKVIPLRQQ